LTRNSREFFSRDGGKPMGKLNIGKNLIHKNHITSHVNAGVMGERNKKKKERKQAALTCRLLERNGKDE